MKNIGELYSQGSDTTHDDPSRQIYSGMAMYNHGQLNPFQYGFQQNMPVFHVDQARIHTAGHDPSIVNELDPFGVYPQTFWANRRKVYRGTTPYITNMFHQTNRSIFSGEESTIDPLMENPYDALRRMKRIQIKVNNLGSSRQI